jgi:threonine/homoserine/homoserine lactone efflux protein
MQILSSLIPGLLLSFLGQLPIGMISLTATQIAVQENFRNAWKYAVGVALVEMIYLRLVLSGIQWITGQTLVFTILNIVTIVFFIVLGILSFRAARKKDQNKKAILLSNNLSRFLLGISVSALNPAQIPFWIIWTAYFVNLRWLTPGFHNFNFFTIGSGLGTLCGLAVYMYGGTWLVGRLKAENHTMNNLAGCVFIIAAMLQLYRVLVH